MDGVGWRRYDGVDDDGGGGWRGGRGRRDVAC